MPRKTLTDDERQAKRDAERQLLADAVAQLHSSEGWQRWLRVRKAFHHYSLNNQLLIALQKPDATRVAGFKAWLKLGYCVRKGERGLRIFAPVPPSKKQLQDWRQAGSDPADKPRTHFRLTAVFDRSQVDALPEPAVPVDLDAPAPALERLHGEDLAELLEPDGALVTLAASIGVTLLRAERPGHMPAAGWFRPKTSEICVYTDASGNDQAATLVHELGHALLHLEHGDERAQLDYAAEELIVESVAYTVCSTLQLDTTRATVPYLASWAEQAPIETLAEHAKLIDQVATRIEEHVLQPEPPAAPEAGSETGDVHARQSAA